MAGYIGTQPVPQATQTRDAFTATSNQTSFPTSGYTPEFLDVFLNGVKLAAADYTATNGSDVVLAVGATTGDILEVVSYGTFEVLNPTFDGNVTFTGNASFGDNDKAIFGDGSDLQIYHDGSNSYIKDAGTGSLRLRGTDLRLESSTLAHNFITCTEGGGVYVYHNDLSKLATTATGIDVTGTVTSDGLTVTGSTGSVATVRLQAEELHADIVSVNEGVNYGGVKIQTNSNGTLKDRLKIESNGDISFYEDTGTTAKFFWDSSAESLGIGTSSPSYKNHTYGTNGTAYTATGSTGRTPEGTLITAQASSGTSGVSATIDMLANGQHAWIGAVDNASGYTPNMVFGQSTGASTWAERMRIDSSGNLLVGTTSTTPAVSNDSDGIALQANGTVQFSANATTTAIINRKSTDGAILQFRKDGTTVGSIGATGGNTFIYGGSGSVANLNFGSTSVVYPSVDNVGDVGASSHRFKDLYLSGGVYLGGTGSANKLDDYEEGTWTPVLSDNSGNNFTMGTQQGFYTKVGNVVTVYFNAQFSNTGSASGLVRFKGFPFTAKNNSGGYYYTGSTINTNGQLSVSLPGNETSAIFHDASSGAGQVSEFNNDRVNGCLTYIAS